MEPEIKSERELQEFKKLESDDEEVPFKWPKDLNFRSDLKFTPKNLEAMEDYLKRAQVFHHLWIQEDHLADIRKAILLYRDVKHREEEHEQQIELMNKIRDNFKSKATSYSARETDESKKTQPYDNKNVEILKKFRQRRKTDDNLKIK